MVSGRCQVQDGPFSHSKEQLAGYVVIEVPDLDAALDWAAKAPLCHHGVGGGAAGDATHGPSAPVVLAARTSYGNLMLRMSRHDRVRADATAQIMRCHDDRTTEDCSFADERIVLLFVCGRPTINPLARTPLMLQTVLGMDAGRIGRAFMMAPAAMGQQLVRAKTKICEARIRFRGPNRTSWPTGCRMCWLRSMRHSRQSGMPCKAMPPREPKALGLLSLILFLHAKRGQ
ncbi:MAG: hypothetical protein H7245_03465 [Candidatus Saccharibacteria bacterium]|nr:hypothetical protein [Pseudorhodobacter sp.]